MPRQLLTDKQLEYIEDGADAVGAANAHNYETTIRENLDEGVPQILSRFPNLVPFIDAENLQEQVDGAEVGFALGQLLTRDQRRRTLAMLLSGEKREDESMQEFVSRVLESIEEYQSDISQSLGQLERSSALMDFLQAISDRLTERLEIYIERCREAEDISMAVPVKRVVEGGKDRQSPDEQPSVPELLDALYSPWVSGVDAKFRDCRNILMSMGMRLDVPSVRSGGDELIEDQWGHQILPTEEDIEQYVAVIEVADEEIQDLVEAYFDEERIAQKEALLEAAFEILDEPSRSVRDVLKRDELESFDPTWKGHHTRVANRWTERDNPLLELERETGVRRVWSWTAFGNIVKTLWDNDVDWADVERTGFPVAIEQHDVHAMISQFDD